MTPLLFLIPASLSAQTVTAPSGAVTVQTSGDFFSGAYQDAADMKDRTDIGWFAYGVDPPRANLSGISIANGVFSATASSKDPILYLLASHMHGRGVRHRRVHAHAADRHIQ